MAYRRVVPIVVLIMLPTVAHAEYLVGIGKADITGPVADVNLMGYAMPLQIARGIHTRLFARAYVFAEPQNDRRRFVYVVSDACMSSQLVTLRVIQRLQEEYGDLYSADNVLLSGTHTHASPAGFLQYLLYTITSLGFVRDSFDALVDGITEAIGAAHNNVSPGDVSWASGELLDANINRSPTAYLANPADERAIYQHDVEKTMDLLRITQPASDCRQAATSTTSDRSGSHLHGISSRSSDNLADMSGVSGDSRSNAFTCGRGMITWFPVHCTSMNNTNPFVTGDNKGAAAQIIERAAARPQAAQPAPVAAETKVASAHPNSIWRSLLEGLQKWTRISLRGNLGRPSKASVFSSTRAVVPPLAAAVFVSAFAQSSVGDTSPNVAGAYCLDTGEPCEMSKSTCGGRNELCVGRGPAWPDDTASTAIIAQRQADKALELWQQEGTKVTGHIDYRHVYINMSDTQVFASPLTREGVTCPPAMGFSFAAGTTDGPGAFDFTQSDTTGSPFWRLVGGLLSKPTAEQVACHAPKPILLNTGFINTPYAWQPHITELSVIRLGNIVLVGVPGEFSSMAGRRMKAAVRDVVGDAWGKELKVVLSGLSNTYSSYITTYEEYQVQRYEGASTAYGPHTLDAYIQTAVTLVKAMLAGEPVSSDVYPPDLESSQISLLGPVVMDTVPFGANFGDVVAQPLPVYTHRQTVEAVFRSGCPRNNLRRGGTFLAVQRLDPSSSSWLTVATDNDWETHFYWERHWKLSTQSFATVRWSIPSDTPNGTYRLVHYGDSKSLFGDPRPFTGVSNSFTVSKDAKESGQRQLLSSLDGSQPLADGTAVSMGPDVEAAPLNLYLAAADPVQLLVQATGSLNGSSGVHQAYAASADPSGLEKRWSALKSLYEPANQYKSRFGCQQHYVAWWRGKAGAC